MVWFMTKRISGRSMREMENMMGRREIGIGVVALNRTDGIMTEEMIVEDVVMADSGMIESADATGIGIGTTGETEATIDTGDVDRSAHSRRSFRNWHWRKCKRVSFQTSNSSSSSL
jgi:hypothetical protein